MRHGSVLSSCLRSGLVIVMGVPEGMVLGCLTWSQDLASALHTSALAHSLCCLKSERSDWNENLCHFRIGSSGFQVCWLIRVGALHLPAELRQGQASLITALALASQWPCSVHTCALRWGESGWLHGDACRGPGVLVWGSIITVLTASHGVFF